MDVQVEPLSVDFQICAGLRSVIHMVPSRPICNVGSPLKFGAPFCTFTNGLNCSGGGTGATPIAIVPGLLVTPFCVSTSGTEGPAVMPGGIRTLTWYSPTNPGASPANVTGAAMPPIVAVTGSTVCAGGPAG